MQNIFFFFDSSTNDIDCIVVAMLSRFHLPLHDRRLGTWPLCINDSRAWPASGKEGREAQ